MAKTTAERLSAYHDRELGLEDAAHLDAQIAGDDDARALLEAFGRVDDAARLGYAAELDAPVPVALARSVRAGFAARRRRTIGRLTLYWVGPAAAAMVILAVGSQWIEQRTASALAQREARIEALTQRVVQDALEHAISGVEVSRADDGLASSVSVTPTRTYRSESDQWCREFVEDVVVDGQLSKRYGLACREPSGDWHRVQTRLPGSKPPPVGQVL